ncbi:MAG TPA: homogentisate 1,2-dioxygenase [Ottowia sp.]|uniref:homogentisate 1,2-dioxygenase n=1 Tax=Ottowia sp. TaxID=1898956 RepID=UPI002B5D9E61|nr:homogentisate 1,2-dioxygenase [Ottowia sp.]HMN22390.1 homogentisate 1,2-dioxygenase [Ottowia sp.]
MAEKKPLDYMSGFGNEFATEALPGALPDLGNSPQQAPYGLYVEQLSGTAFTAPRHANRRTWLYRIRPGAVHGAFEPCDAGRLWRTQPDDVPPPPNRLRWDPTPIPTSDALDFIDGMTTMGVSATTSINIYAANRSMDKRYFYDADGELLIVPQQGRLELATELGVLEIGPSEIAVIPRGVRFQVRLLDGSARGWVCENRGHHLVLPTLGVIGSNGLAHPRDFLTPVAAYEDVEGDFEIVAKFGGHFWKAPIGNSPLDVVAWHGTSAPYKYDLRRFNAVGSITYDHPDPSIFLVLHAPSATPGVDTLDFVVFAPRVLAMIDTFRPPWLHRNIASEFMGNIHGVYDAKASGFPAGASSLHSCMTAHGPDVETFEKASHADISKPDYITDQLAFMFETPEMICPTRAALESPQRQQDYYKVWQGFKKYFNPNQR